MSDKKIEQEMVERELVVEERGEEKDEVVERLKSRAERAREERDANLTRIRTGVRLGCRWCSVSFSAEGERESHEGARHGRRTGGFVEERV